MMYNPLPPGYLQNGFPVEQYPGQFPQQPVRPHITKRDILGYIQSFTSASEIKQVDSFDTLRTRHICAGMQGIKLLDKTFIEVPVGDGSNIPVEVFVCPVCRKVIVNKQSLEFY